MGQNCTREEMAQWRNNQPYDREEYRNKTDENSITEYKTLTNRTIRRLP